MSVLHQLPCTPDKDAMREMLDALFSHATDGLIELTWTAPTYPHKPTKAALFNHDQLDEIADEAERINLQKNCNVYVSAGLRRKDLPRNVRGGDGDVIAIAALKVDCDNPGSLQSALQVCEALGLEPSFALYTGRHPHPRGALWWVLEAQTTEMDRVRSIESALQRKLGSDPAVVNSSRIMRLAGSVAWPMKEGRILEMTGVETAAITRPRPYALDEIAAALRAAGALEKPPETAQVLDFNPAKANLDLETLARAAREPGRWHEHTLRAVAHLVGRGLPADLVEDSIALAFTCPGYSVHQTRKELRSMIDGAVKKWGPRPEPVEPSSSIPFVSIADLLKRPPPTWLIDAFLPEHAISVLWGASGSFKSFIALDIALSVAYGQPWRGQAVPAAKPVLYVAGEGSYGLGVRALVWMANRAPGDAFAHFYVLPFAVDMLSPKSVAQLVADIGAFGVEFGMIIVDTLARNFGSGNENDAVDMNKFVIGVDALRVATTGHVMVVHHTGKDDQKGERGSSALRGAVDVSLKVSREEGSPLVRVQCVKQKDAPEPDSFTLRMVAGEAVHPAHGEIVTSLLPVFEPSSISMRAGGKIGRVERDILAALEDGPATSRTLAKRLGADPGNVQRSIRTLIAKNLVITADGLHELAVVTSQSESNQ